MPTTAGRIDLKKPGGVAGSPGAKLRYRLKVATADAHARLDGRLGSLDLRRLSDYRMFLEASGAALLPLEQALIDAGVHRHFPDWPSRSRGAAILEDLARVRGDVPVCPVIEPLNTGVMFGTLYMLEGSRLGARVLLQSRRGLVCRPMVRLARCARQAAAHAAR